MASKKLRKTVRQLAASPGDVNKSPCAFCQRNIDDEVIFGKLYAIGDIQCHYFCVLLSCCLIQKGKDEEGLFGFLYKDILAEIERSKKHKCSYCGKVGASLGCSVSQCRKQFHLPCGRDKNAVSLFHGNYKSYCQQHAPKQKIPEHILSQANMRKKLAKSSLKLQQPKNFSDLKELTPVKNVDGCDLDSIPPATESVCVICYETVDGYSTPQTFWPPCCARDAWFHRSCLQRMALTAGMHYLKCPLCNDKDYFYHAVLAQGIYVPDRDAAWELEQNAFVDIYSREVSCGARPCQCRLGRGYDEGDSVWEIIMCVVCGDGSCHEQCSGASSRRRYVCEACRALLGDVTQLQHTIQSAIEKEESVKKVIRHVAPVMPSRMSLRRTKQRTLLNMPSTSTQNTETSRLELNLKPPRKRQLNDTTTNKQQDLFSPTKVIKDSLTNTLGDVDSKLIESVKERFKKPRPLSVKKKIVKEILDNYLSKLNKHSPKTKKIPKEWISPKKCDNDNVQNKKTPLKIHFKTKDSSLRSKSITPTKTIKDDKELDNDTKFEYTPPKNTNENCFEDTPHVNNGEDKLVTPKRGNKCGSVVKEGSNNKTPNKLNTDAVKDAEYISNDKKNVSITPKKTNKVWIEDCNGKKSIKDCVEGSNDMKTNTNDSNKDKNEESNSTKNSVVNRIEDKEDTENTVQQTEIHDESSNSTFQLPSEFIADTLSDDSIPFLETPKLKTVDIENDSLEISNNDQTVNIDMYRVDNDSESVNDKLLQEYYDSKQSLNENIDAETFKNQYLTEVDRNVKCYYNHKHIKEEVLKTPVKLRTAIDFAVEAFEKENSQKKHKNINKLKRKLNAEDKVPKKKKKVKKDSLQIVCSKKTEASLDLRLNSKIKHKKIKRKMKKNKKVNIRNIQVKIKWKKEELKLQISDGNRKKKKLKNKKDEAISPLNLKQYVLKYSPETSKNVISKPEENLTPIKRKYIKQEKTVDNFKQTSIQNFFKKLT